LLHLLGCETSCRNAGYARSRLRLRALHPFVADAVARVRQGQSVGILQRCSLDAFILFGRLPGRLRRARLPDVLHEMHALLAQETLDAADGVTLAIKKMTDAA